jgi:flagellar hook-associated protein 1 FlgK
MSLLTSLTSGASALNADSYALQITGKNLANTNNTSYARETVVFGSVGGTNTGLGAANSAPVAQSVSQVRSAFLDQQVCQENSITSSLTTQQTALQNAEAALGETLSSSSTTSTGAGASLSSQLTSLFNSFSSLAATPTDTGVQQTLVQNAATLTNTLNQTDAGLAQVQTGLATQIQGDTSNVNTLLQTIAGLNSQITVAEVGSPGSAVDLRDQRQAALQSLSADISFTSSTDASGQLQLTATDASGNPVVLVDGGTVSNTVAFDGTNLTAGGDTLAPASGSIAGALTASNGAIQTLRSSLDALAQQLVTSVNAAYNPSGTTGNFFDASGTTAGTIALDPSLSATDLTTGASGNPGDNTIALAVANLANQNFSTSAGDAIDGTMTQFYSGTVSAFGQTLSNLNNSVENQTAVQTLVQSQQSSVSGVNIDEETTNLMMYQKAYEASSQFISVINNILETLVSIPTSTA